MKKILLFFAFAAFVSAATAAEPAKKPSVAGFVTNGFWDNWELSLGGGVGTALSNGDNPGAFGDRLGFEANFSATKWLHPAFGGRFQLQGGQFANFDPSYGKMKWPYLFAHIDAMFNISNWFGGYRADRAYYCVPFVGFGYMASNITDKSHTDNHRGTSHNFAMSYGILNKFRLSRSFDFNIELKGLLVPSQMSPAKMPGSYLFGFSATAGFTYRFNKRDWERGIAGYTADDIRRFQQAVADGNEALASAKAENGRLNSRLQNADEELAAAKALAAAEAAKAAKAEADAARAREEADQSVILYDYGMAVLSQQELTRLQLLAQKIKQGPQDRVYNIGGHADHQTGTAAANQRLSERRAKAVYDYLVKQGVNPKQLKYEGFGGVDNPFSIQKANRSAVVKIQ
jgi:outer membrane protein OmpA-like peptidoglycan-associated protein